MREKKVTKRFKKDAKAAKARGKDMSKLASVIKKPQKDQVLDPSYRDHALVGNWKPKRECHIEPDWLLIYDISQSGLLILVGTGLLASDEGCIPCRKVVLENVLKTEQKP